MTDQQQKPTPVPLSHEHDSECDHVHGSLGQHHHAPEVSSKNERVVLIGFLLTFGFMIAEVIGGLLSGSLALIADAGHMFTDSAALALAWAGFHFGRRQGDDKRTFGYMRFEILAGFVNAITLILLVGWIIYEAIQRLITPGPVLAGPMLVIATLGLIVNIGVFWMLTQGDRDHVNIQGAMIHVLGDLLGSVAAIVAAVAIYFSGWMPIDPLLSLFISVIVLRSAWILLKSSLNILMEGSPQNVVVSEMRAALIEKVHGVTGISHVHVWSITSGKPVATLEIEIEDDGNPAQIVRDLKATMAAEFGITHSTVEIDWDGNASYCSIDASADASAESGDPDRDGHEHADARSPGSDEQPARNEIGSNQNIGRMLISQF